MISPPLGVRDQHNPGAEAFRPFRLRRVGKRGADASGNLTAELLGLHAQILLRMPVYQALLVAAFAWILLPHVPLGAFLAWAAIALSAEAIRAISAKLALARLPNISPASLRHTHAVLIVLDGLAGLATGLVAVLFLHQVPLLTQTLLAIILVGVSTAGTAVALSARRIVAAYSTAILLCVGASWIQLHPVQAPVLAAMTVVYWFFLLGVARDAEHVLARSIAIRRERDDANRELADKNCELEEKNCELNHVNQQLAQATRDRSRILAATSHDLRQPLQALSIYSAVLSADPSPQALEKVGRNIEYVVQSIGDMLDNLVDLARLSAGNYPLRQQAFRFDDLVCRICDAFAANAGAKGLQLTCDTRAAVILHSDPVAVSRVLRNFLDNAVKYTECGWIRVQLDLDGSSAVLRVCDSGPGIDPAQQEHIFDEFYQVAPLEEAPLRGAGLGLAIVKRFCDALGATPSVASVPGQGSCFSVAWPNASSVSAPTPRADNEERSGNPIDDRLPVYVVDDDPSVGESLRQLLALWGYPVSVAEDGPGAELLFAQRGRPALLITDLRLGAGEDGLDFARRLRAQYGEFPVLLISGESQDVAVARAQEAGVALLHKPVTSFKLRKQIDRLL